MAFRKFLLKRDPTFIGYVFGIAHRHITNEEFVARLAAAREKWNDAMKKGNVVYKVNDDQLTPELVMDLWINGGCPHDDLEKDGRLQELEYACRCRGGCSSDSVGDREQGDPACGARGKGRVAGGHRFAHAGSLTLFEAPP